MHRVVPSQVVELIDQVFPSVKAEEPFSLNLSHAVVLAGMVRLVDEIPDELLRLDSKIYAEFIAAVEGIRQSLATWPHQGSTHTLSKIPGLYKVNPLRIVRQALAQCADEYPPAEIAGLEFISDPALRGNLRLDIASINRALANHEYKVATVLAGSAVEAMLLWALEQREEKEVQAAISRAQKDGWIQRVPAGELIGPEWSLRQFAEAAGELGLVTKSTRQQLRLATDFRNLIHPGRAKRLNEACDRGTALATASGLELVIRDLSR